MTVWRILKCVCGVACVIYGLFNKEFKPIGWTTLLIWGRGKDDRIPRWIAGPFYFVGGLLVFYWGITGK